RLINLLDFKDIEVIRPAPSDPFDVPEVVTIRFPSPEDIPPLERRRLSGKVIAIWRGNCILVKGVNGDVHTVELSGSTVPKYGAMIEAAGLLKTDLYRMNLSDAIWRHKDIAEMNDDAVEEVRNILTDAKGASRIIPTVHGRTFRIRGTVQDRPSSDMQYALVTLKCGSETIPVDVSANRAVLDDISIGCVIEVTGTCIVECDNWHSYSAFPHVTSVTLVPRQPSDVRVIAYPPWWTPSHLLIVIGILLAVLLGVVMRNRMQKRNSARLAKLATDLKVEERTRLAVELHDSLAQNLTGVSMEIDTAGKLADEDPKAMRDHLDQAARTLKSCRDELRNCLWDLRNRALEEGSMDEAIRQTLAPHVAGVEVAIRFNVPRERISDNTTHAILRIIRELAINAVRHGHAKKIWIAGSVEADKLLFSVRDDGCGFDPASAPGFAEGHYGLVGITERVESFEGEFDVESSPGKGTKASVKLKMESVK
ncbi:MAG: sensor histidine kinase, partial [Kiritimatiellae bacterium]|nr:sensor histidine kinase [Kiritimatiellia bacterium]